MASSPRLVCNAYFGCACGHGKNANGCGRGQARGQERMSRNRVADGDVLRAVTQGNSFLAAGLWDGIQLRFPDGARAWRQLRTFNRQYARTGLCCISNMHLCRRVRYLTKLLKQGLVDYGRLFAFRFRISSPHLQPSSSMFPILTWVAFV